MLKGAVDAKASGHLPAARLRLSYALAQAPGRDLLYGLLAASLDDLPRRVSLFLTRQWLDQFSDFSALWARYWYTLQESLLLSSPEEESLTADFADADLTPVTSLSALSELQTRLPWVSEAVELRAIVQLLRHMGGMQQQLGVCRFDSRTKILSGWALNTASAGNVPKLLVRLFSSSVGERRKSHAHHLSSTAIADAELLNLSNESITEHWILANSPNALLQSAGFGPNHGGFSVRLPDYCERVEVYVVSPSRGANAAFRPVDDPLSQPDNRLDSTTNFEANKSAVEDLVLTPLVGSPLAASEPLFESSSALYGCSELAQTASEVQQFSVSPIVDVLVPVFNGGQATLSCLRSLLAARDRNITTHEIIVLDDASSDDDLVKELDRLAQAGQITLIRHSTNLGFIRNVNHGMTLHPDRDVVWLNSDTLVSDNWLDRLNRLAHQENRIASVTPFSNNAELMSLAGYQVPSAMPNMHDQSVIDRQLKDLALPAVDIPAGCGFCFYVTRAALRVVGLLDEVNLIDGYGEETDWCLRARTLGWRHLGACNVFVGHAGGQSFGMRKRLLAKHNNKIIRQRYPLADRIHNAFRAHDPLQPLREQIAASLTPLGITVTPHTVNTSAASIHSLVLDHGPTQQWLADLPEWLPGHWPGQRDDHPVVVIADDLSNESVVQAWLHVAKHGRDYGLVATGSVLSGVAAGPQRTDPEQGERSCADSAFGLTLLILDDTPGSALLEKSGLGVRIAAPVGLRWDQWLPLLGVCGKVHVKSIMSYFGDGGEHQPRRRAASRRVVNRRVQKQIKVPFSESGDAVDSTVLV